MVGCKYSLTHNPVLIDAAWLICGADTECLHEYNTCCLIMCVFSEPAHLSTCLLRNMSINFLLSIMEIDETIERERAQKRFTHPPSFSVNWATLSCSTAWHLESVSSEDEWIHTYTAWKMFSLFQALHTRINIHSFHCLLTCLRNPSL